MGFERNYKNTLMVFKRKVLRRIFGPTNERDGRHGESKQTIN
jgi:hypothetical protein